MGSKIDMLNFKSLDIKILNESIERSPKGEILWECLCNCGNKFLAKGTDIRRNRIKSCNACKVIKSKRTPFNTLYDNYKRNAFKRKLDFKLTKEYFEILIKKSCYYCGYPPSQIIHKKGTKHELKYNGIDRLDNTIGYTIENSVPCCKFCNFAKKNTELEGFLDWLNHLKNSENVY